MKKKTSNRKRKYSFLFLLKWNRCINDHLGWIHQLHQIKAICLSLIRLLILELFSNICWLLLILNLLCVYCMFTYIISTHETIAKRNFRRSFHWSNDLLILCLCMRWKTIGRSLCIRWKSNNQNTKEEHLNRLSDAKMKLNENIKKQ